jgi:hypothetical protein
MRVGRTCYLMRQRVDWALNITLNAYSEGASALQRDMRAAAVVLTAVHADL